MEKRKIKKQIVFKSFDSTPTWKDLKEIQEKTPFQDDDMIAMLWLEEDCEFIISVERYIEETDQEFEDRVKQIEINKIEAKKKRKESYLKLKEEFEKEASSDQ